MSRDAWSALFFYENPELVRRLAKETTGRRLPGLARVTANAERVRVHTRGGKSLRGRYHQT